MSKRKLNVERLKNTRLMYGIISILLAAIIAFVAIPMLSSKISGITEVVTLTSAVSKGDVILKEHVVLTEVGEYNLPTDIALLPEDVIGKYAATDLVPGDYILSANVSDFPITSDINLEYLPDGKMAMSFSVKTLASGLSGKLQTGDVIRMYHFKEVAKTFEELSFVKVLSVTDSDGYNIDATREIEEDEEKPLSSTVTVLVSPEQALLITDMEGDGSIHVSLVVRNNPTLAEELLARQDEVILELYPEDTEDENTEGDTASGSDVDTSDASTDETGEVSNTQTVPTENNEIGG